MSTETPKHTYLNVVFTRAGIAEMDGAAQAVFLAQQEIERVELMSGTGAEQPVVQTVFGAGLVLVGLFSVKSIWLWFEEGGTLFDLQVALVIFMFLGGWMLWGVLRNRIYLLVTTKNDRRKIVFHGPVDRQQLAQFIQTVNSELRYNIQSRLPA